MNLLVGTLQRIWDHLLSTRLTGEFSMLDAYKLTYFDGKFTVKSSKPEIFPKTPSWLEHLLQVTMVVDLAFCRFIDDGS